MKTKKI